MAIIVPDLYLLKATANAQSIGKKHFDKTLANDVTGDVYARRFSPPRWAFSLNFHDAFTREIAARWEVLLHRLDGQINQLALHDVKHPAPRGTLRGALTLASALAQGAESMTLNVSAGQVGATLLAGDRLGFGSLSSTQMVVVLDDAVVSAGNQITVQFKHPARVPHASGAPVVWDRPVALFRSTSDSWSYQRRPGLDGGLAIELIESWNV